MEVVMLERCFVKPETVDRILASWIAEPIEAYVSWMAEHGYAARNVFRRVPMLVQFGAFAKGRRARNLKELPEHVDAFVAEYLRKHRKPRWHGRSVVEQMLRVALPDLVISNRRTRKRDPFISQAPGFF
jgi:hypothetical protein